MSIEPSFPGRGPLIGDGAEDGISLGASVEETLRSAAPVAGVSPVGGGGVPVEIGVEVVAISLVAVVPSGISEQLRGL